MATISDSNGIVFYTFQDSNQENYQENYNKIQSLEFQLKVLEDTLLEETDHDLAKAYSRQIASLKLQIQELYNYRKFFEVTKSSTAIRESIVRILMTKRGERVNNPNFGSNISKYIFMPDMMITDLMNEIKSSIETNEPRVTVTDVTLLRNKEDAVSISVNVLINSTNESTSVNVNL